MSDLPTHYRGQVIAELEPEQLRQLLAQCCAHNRKLMADYAAERVGFLQRTAAAYQRAQRHETRRRAIIFIAGLAIGAFITGAVLVP